MPKSAPTTEALARQLVKGLKDATPGRTKAPLTWNIRRDGKVVAEVLARPSVCVIYVREVPPAKLLKQLKLEAAPAPARADTRPASASPKWAFRAVADEANADSIRALLEAVAKGGETA